MTRFPDREPDTRPSTPSALRSPATPEEVQAMQRLVGVNPDGRVGPQTVNALVAWLQARGFLEPQDTTMTARETVLQIANEYIGECDPLPFFEDCARQFVDDRSWTERSWCGIFALYCLRKAGLVDWTWQTGVGFLYRLRSVSLPEPGDIAYFGANQHHAIVVEVAQGKAKMINGNGYPKPRRGVTVTTRPLSDAAAYYSIGKLIP
jgi:hypothetical protein